LLGKNHRGIPLESQYKIKRLSNPPFSDHAGRVNCSPILKSHTDAKGGDAMTKEEHRSYWRFETRIITSILRFYFWHILPVLQSESKFYSLHISKNPWKWKG